MELKLTAIGNSTGIILPQALLEKLRVKRGETLHVIETPNGIELTPYDPDFAEQMAAGREAMAEFRDALHQLAQ